MNNQNIVLDVRNVSQLFGGRRNQQNALEMVAQGISRDEIQRQTGAFVAVRDASFVVHQGEFFIIMGLSGCGKSTLLRSIIRLIEPVTGEVLINGRDIMKLSDKEVRQLRSRETAMVFQRYGLQPHRTVMENVEFGLYVRGIPRKQRRERVFEAIAQVGLQGWEDEYPNALSGGMQQRVGVARALANDPQLLLMDEPFSGLDPLIRNRMQREFARLQEEIGHTTIMVTHDLDEALTLGDRIAIMREGEIVQIATPNELVTNPADEYIESFVEGASLAKVLTAKSIMDSNVITIQPDMTDLRLTIQRVIEEHERGSFVVDADQQLIGRIWLHALRESANDTGGGGNWVDQVERAVSTSPDAALLDVFPLVIGTRFPVAVVDESGVLVGQITKNKLLETLIHDVEYDHAGDAGIAAN
ncbi:MAG: ATP-binding cassette domain-containing protein [Sphaerobacteraceae bacterium]|nr:MAG: ATP-binding cassette domain-containing protein [Sphaerobacteraceae bacterium]